MQKNLYNKVGHFDHTQNQTKTKQKPNKNQTNKNQTRPNKNQTKTEQDQIILILVTREAIKTFGSHHHLTNKNDYSTIVFMEQKKKSLVSPQDHELGLYFFLGTDVIGKQSFTAQLDYTLDSALQDITKARVGNYQFIGSFPINVLLDKIELQPTITFANPPPSENTEKILAGFMEIGLDKYKNLLTKRDMDDMKRIIGKLRDPCNSNN